MKVIFVVGYPKSGSTILGNVLNETEGIFHAGEVFHMWKKGRPWTESLYRSDMSEAEIKNRYLTGSTNHFTRDPVWGGAWTRAIRRVSKEDSERAFGEEAHKLLFDLHAEALYQDSKVAFFRINDRRQWGRATGCYAEYSAELYEGLGEYSGSHVVVDTSKRPSFARFVASIKGVKAYFVHVVRDPRAVAYSRQRLRKVMRNDGTAELDRLHLARVLAKWALVDLKTDVLKRKLGPERYLRVRYEDFARAPRRVLRNILNYSEERGARLPFVGERTVELTKNHAIGGNTNRARRGPIEIQESTKWKREMQPLDQRLCTVLALPYLLKYHYPLKLR